VLLVPNVLNPAAVAAAGELARELKGRGEVAMASADAEASGLEALGVPTSEIGQPSLAVALGGDGTILKAFHLLGEQDVPILGVKFGRLGFLSGSSADDMLRNVDAALEGRAGVERRATLKAEVHMDGRVTGTYRAMNEVVVARSSSGRVVTFSVSISGKQVARHRADGIVVATATGSTAYALSAGGPIVSPGYAGLVVVPVAPHTLRSRAVVTAPEDTVEISFPEPARSDTCVVVDGDAAPCRQRIERVVVMRGDSDVTLVKCDGRDFYETIAEEFFGG
jgi:NAD+ kinase